MLNLLAVRWLGCLCFAFAREGFGVVLLGIGSIESRESERLAGD